MRIGFNPNKDKLKQQLDYYHQVIVPVHIPNFNGYHKESFDILKLSLNSLFKTIHKKTFVTVVNNDSCVEVTNYLDKLFRIKQVNELIHTDKVGKLNAVIKGLVGHKFLLITIVDADVLFLNNWQKATYQIFENFKKAGAVCTTPSSRSLFTYTQNIWFDKLLSKQMLFSEVVDSVALKMFGKSVGDEAFYTSTQLNKYLTVFENNVSAVVGAGHFMCTYRADIFEKLPKLYSNYALGGDSEAILLDMPVIRKDYWRLSTTGNFTYHLGNVTEDWMFESFKQVKECNEEIPAPKLKPVHSYNILTNFIKNKVFRKIMFRKRFRSFLMRLKGLEFSEIKDYKC